MKCSRDSNGTEYYGPGFWIIGWLVIIVFIVRALFIAAMLGLIMTGFSTFLFFLL
ncbi:MAG: hypothetical protein MN733_10760 [Nitrososphaera sp.]|nr:hypothetical protein [Nitrososphaera sp.]